MRILLWHVHGSWTDAFVHGRHEYLLPQRPEGGPWGLGRGGRDWPANAREVTFADLTPPDVDLVVLQREEEAAEVIRVLGLRPGVDLPAVYVEHNTPRTDVPGTRHPMGAQTRIPIAHVTHFNAVMWDARGAPATVIEHGIRDPGHLYTGEEDAFAFVGNEPVRRSRVLGADLLPAFARHAPIDVFGMGTDDLPTALGLGADRIRIQGDVPRDALHSEMARRRAYLHPVRWTSLGLSLLEAMHIGMPVLALATTEAPRAIPADAGVVSADVRELAEAAHWLLQDPQQAARMGRAARSAALASYGLDRFLSDWDTLLDALVTAGPAAVDGLDLRSHGSPAASTPASPTPARNITRKPERAANAARETNGVRP